MLYCRGGYSDEAGMLFKNQVSCIRMQVLKNTMRLIQGYKYQFASITLQARKGVKGNLKEKVVP